jgi:hypothetical protein
MPYSHVRIHGFLLVLSAMILTQSPLRAAQSNPKLESAYGLPHANLGTKAPRQAGDEQTDAAKEAGAASSSPVPAQSEQPRHPPAGRSRQAGRN